MIEADPLAWLRGAGLPGSVAALIDAELSTITSEADRILRVKDPDYLAHIEAQASFDDEMIQRLLRYNVLIFVKYGIAVISILFLLRKQAERKRYPGVFSYRTPDGSGVEFRYRVVRVWELNAEEILNGPLAMLPLAPVSNIPRARLPEAVARMQTRIAAEATPAEANTFWASAYFLMGMKYKDNFIDKLLKGVKGMEESSTYQLVLSKGRAQGEAEGITKGERKMLLLSGEKRLGAPDAATRAEIETITSSERLERLMVRMWEVESWRELLRAE